MVGFASRNTDLTLHLPGAIQGSEGLLGKLGKHKTGKGCLYIKRLDDVDLGILEKLVQTSIKHTLSKKA